MNKIVAITLGLTAVAGFSFYMVKRKPDDLIVQPVEAPVTTTPAKVKAVPVVTPTPAVIGNVVYWNKKADESVVNFYKTITDYPGKPFVSLPVGKKSRAAMKYLGFQGFVYAGSNVTTALYQVLIGTMSTPVFVPSYYFSQNPNS